MTIIVDFQILAELLQHWRFCLQLLILKQTGDFRSIVETKVRNSVEYVVCVWWRHEGESFHFWVYFSCNVMLSKLIKPFFKAVLYVADKL